MKVEKRRILSIVLAILLMFQFIPANAMEGEEPTKALGEAFDYTIFAANPNTPCSMELSNGFIKGHIHTNNSYVFRGSTLTIEGVCEASEAVVTEGSDIEIDQTVEGTSIVEMPDYTNDIKRIITTGNSVYDVYHGDKQYNGNNITVENSILIDGKMSANCSGFTAEGYIFAKDDIAFNTANNDLGMESGIVLCSENGNITFNSSITRMKGIVYAPKGTVTINSADFILSGRIIADKIIVRGKSVAITGNNDDIDLVFKESDIIFSSIDEKYDCFKDHEIQFSTVDQEGAPVSTVACTVYATGHAIVDTDAITDENGNAFVTIRNEVPETVTLMVKTRKGISKSVALNFVFLPIPEAPVAELEIVEEKPCIKWNRVEHADSYTIKRGTESGRYTELVTNVSDTSYTDLNIDEGKTYYYVVSAVNDSGESPNSNEVVFMSIPEAPILSGRKIGDCAWLSWVSSNGASWYNVYRSSRSGGPYIQIAQNILGNAYDDRDLTEEAIFFYVVTAENEKGQSVYSNEVEVRGDTETRIDYISETDDDDGDGLTNLEELFYATNPLMWDSDNDGLSDGQEIELGTDPLNPDTMGDGIYDGAKVSLGLDPLTVVEDPESLSITKSARLIGGEAEVTAEGNGNFILAPLQIKKSDDVLINSLEGIVGNAVEITSGGYPIKEAQITFHYSADELNGIPEENLAIFYVNRSAKSLEPLSDITIDTENKTVTAKTNHFSTFLLADSNIPIDLSKVDIVFSIDQSGSMSSNDRDYYRLQATKQFIEKMDETNNRIGVVEFSSSATIKNGLTNDKERLLNVINGMYYNSGSTNIRDSLVKSGSLFTDSNRRKVIILLTDGEDSYSSDSQIIEQARSLAAQDIVINTIALGRNVDTALLQQIASVSKGGYFYINNESGLTPEDVEKQIQLVYEKLAKQLTLQEYTEDRSKLPKRVAHIEFSDLYKGFEYEETDRWLSRANANLLTGNYMEHITDISIQSEGIDLTFERIYNSFSNEQKTVIGNGFRTNYDSKLENKGEIGIVTASLLNVREGTGTDHRVLGRLTRGTEVEIIESNVEGKPWHKIRYFNLEAYVHSSYITMENSSLIEVTYPSGTKILFRENEEGKFSSPMNTDDILEKVGDEYVLTRKDLSKLIYDAHKRLIAIEDRNGNAVTVHYSNSKIERVTDPVGRDLTFSYNADGLIDRVTDPSGRYVSYEYDANGNLVEVTDLNGESTEYTYDASNRINKKTDANGNQAIRNEYDSLGRIVRQYDGKDHIKYHIYDDENYTRYLIDENGIESRVEFNINLMPIVNTNTYGEKVLYRYSYYDSDTGDWIDITDLTDASEEYRSYVEKARDKGLKTREEVIDKKGNKTINEFDEDRNLVAITDAMSNRIFMTYDSKGNLTSLQDKKGGITTYTYDAAGILLTQKTDAMGNVTEYEYYSKGEATSVPGIDIRQSGLVKSIILHKTDKNGVTIPDFQRTTYKYEDDYNYITSITDGVGNTTSYRYDSVGRVIEQVDPRGNSVYFSYDMMDRLLSQTDSLGNEQIYTYDGVGNRISSTDKLGATTYYEYDSKNQLVKVIDPMGYGITYQYDPRGNLVRETNPKGGETRYVYDSINRLVMKTDPLGHTTVYEYDVDPEGNQNDPDYHNVKVIDAEGNVSITEYDCLNRVAVEKQLLENPYYDSASKEIAVTYTYDLNDNIETVTDPMGKVTKYSYDDLNRIVAVTDGFGLGGILEATTETEYDAKAEAGENVSIVTVIDPSGERTQTHYDAIDRTIKEVDAKGYETLYSYDGNGNLLTTTDPEGNTNTFEYDALNRVIKAYDAENNYITYEYDANGNKTAEVDRKGNRTEFIYDRNNRLVQITDALSGITKYTHDEMGNIATQTDPENHTKVYQYNDAGMLICEEDAENNSKHYTYDALGRVTFESGWINPGIGITTEYDEAGRVKQIIDALGNSTEYTYDLVGNMKTLKDANGNITAYEYDQRYQLVTEIEPGDHTIDENRIDYEYDVLGRLVKKQDSFGTVTEYEYDQLSRIIATIVRDEDNLVEIAEYKTYNGNGQVLTLTDGNSVTTTYEYNSLNLLKAQTKDGKTTSYTYDNNGNLQAETDWRGNTYTYSYDELNRLQQKRDPYNNTIETLVYYKNGAQQQSIDALGNATTFYYDGNGRLVKTEDPEGNASLTEYDGDGNVIRSTDGGGNTTEYEYDSAARLISVRNALNETTAYTYDHNGNMLTQKDGEGNITSYKYNVRNLPYQRIDDGGEGVASKTESYTYYANNLLKTKTDRNGTVISYTYDVFGRLQKEIAGSLQTSYTYDNNGNPLTINDSIGTTIRTYDAMNRVTSKTVPNMGTVTYEYDIIEGVGAGETAERTTDPKGNITTKIYDRAGRLKAVIDGDITSTDITAYEYYANGSRLSVTYPTGIKEEYTYYPDNTLWTLTNKDADGTILDVYTYTYDEANNQTSKHEVINGIDKGTTSYIYDRLNRLLTVTEPSGRETGYTYDMAGNRTMELISSGSETISNIYSYNEQNRLVYITTQVDSELTEKTEYCYDHNGNQLETIVTEYIDGVAQTPVTAAVNTYDSKNQLIETVTADGTTLTNAYNGEGLRVSKTVNGQTTTFLYEYNKVVLETNADGTEKARNLYGTNLLMRTVDGESYYYLYNGHADVTALIDTDGNIAATYYYDAFGNILDQTGAVDNNITYAGYQYDDETGLYYLNARMYDPKIARFLQEDTYRGDPNDPLSLNLYAYCRNNPLVYWDPTGNIPQEDAISLTRELKAYKNIIPIDIMGYYKELFGIYEKYGVDYTSIPEYEEYTNIINSYYGSITSIDPQNIRTQDQAIAYVKQQKFEHAILEAYVNQEYRAAWANISNEITRPVGYGEDPEIRKINIRQTLNNVREIERIAAIPGYTVSDIVKKAAITLALNDMANVAADYYLIQNSRIEQLREALYYNIMIYGISSVNLPSISNVRSSSGIKDPGYYYVNGEKVYYEKPAGYIFETDAQFASHGSQTAFSVLYPDGKFPWVEGTRSTQLTADDIKFSDKFSKPAYKNQITERGWTNRKIADTINNPVKTGTSVNKYTGNSVTVYYIDDVHYVAVDDVTGKVIQVADLNKADWVFDLTK